MITIKQKGNFSKLDMYFEKILSAVKLGKFDKYGRMGVDALSSATPIDTGLTAESWYYETKITKSGLSLSFQNSNVVDGVSIAIILQYGHATRNGGYVKGRDYINPAIQPIFDQIANDMWGEVTKL